MSWLVFSYHPTALFSLKTSRATSTVGRTLLVPTPYSVKMAFVDAGLRSGLLGDPNEFIRRLAHTEVRIGVPEDACVTGTIQKIRQEPKKRSADQPYVSNIALREVVYFRGSLTLAFEDSDGSEQVIPLAPAINYFGKRGSFFQYEGCAKRESLDSTFTRGLLEPGEIPLACHIATLDDFGAEANFDALNSFSSTPMKRGKHRTWSECIVPLGVRNVGPTFTHYRR